ncbi:hypothetical protein IFM89_006403 [Coptis chinensis]|uniref:RNase H type-1 domain-containing protein n=1 Tax=Coptis chinensis TaxID=261450 RepID=A0A835HS39_9MAGN|nr:hypothetical protein IFM89_006403 [Coptis chinensis]
MNTCVDIYKAFVGATVHEIWCERNKRKKNHLNRTPQQLISKIMSNMKIYLQKTLTNVKNFTGLQALTSRLGLELNFTVQEQLGCTWSALKDDNYMLNTDGSVQDGGNGYGGMIKDALGNILLAYTANSTKTSVIYQELQAIAEGLNNL